MGRIHRLLLCAVVAWLGATPAAAQPGGPPRSTPPPSHGDPSMPNYVPVQNARTIKGVLAGPTPWHVALYVDGAPRPGLRCGGVLVARQWVLTVTDCLGRSTASGFAYLPEVRNASGRFRLQALVGAQRLPATPAAGLNIDRIVVQANGPSNGGLALLHLAADAGPGARPISSVTAVDGVGEAARARTYGWSDLGQGDSALLVAARTVVSSARCTQAYFAAAPSGAGAATDLICAAAADADTGCQDLAGEPLVVARIDMATQQSIFRLVGLTRFSGACVKGGGVDVYVGTARFAGWIDHWTMGG